MLRQVWGTIFDCFYQVAAHVLRIVRSFLRRVTLTIDLLDSRDSGDSGDSNPLARFGDATRCLGLADATPRLNPPQRVRIALRRAKVDGSELSG